jgi:hypothetical protein
VTTIVTLAAIWFWPAVSTLAAVAASVAVSVAWEGRGGSAWSPVAGPSGRAPAIRTVVALAAATRRRVADGWPSTRPQWPSTRQP